MISDNPKLCCNLKWQEVCHQCHAANLFHGDQTFLFCAPDNTHKGWLKFIISNLLNFNTIKIWPNHCHFWNKKDFFCLKCTWFRLDFFPKFKRLHDNCQQMLNCWWSISSNAQGSNKFKKIIIRVKKNKVNSNKN